MGGYEILSRIGIGGMGIVYEVQPPHGDVPLALKLLHPHRLDDTRAIRRFEDEAVAGSIVSHPNLAATTDRGQTPEGIPYLVMRRVHGEPLGTMIQRDGMPALRDSVDIVRQVLSAIGAIHAAGIVHGDVKSDNVLVERRDDGGWFATLIDLGLAHVQFCEADVRPRPPDDELVSGTPEYMAPEVIRGEGSTIASDLYAAGVILYELIAGTTPFVGGTPGQIMRRHLVEEIVPPSLRRDATIPPVLERTVLRALAKAPEDRFPSAEAFASALEVAAPLLSTPEYDARPGTRFSRDASTIEWTRPIARPPRRLPRGTPRYERRASATSPDDLSRTPRPRSTKT